MQPNETIAGAAPQVTTVPTAPPMDAQTAVRLALAAKNTNLTALARSLGMSQQSLYRTVHADLLQSRSNWHAILAALDLEVVVQPRRR